MGENWVKREHGTIKWTNGKGDDTKQLEYEAGEEADAAEEVNVTAVVAREVNVSGPLQMINFAFSK